MNRYPHRQSCLVNAHISKHFCRVFINRIVKSYKVYRSEFENAEIEQVRVHQKSKQWDFHFFIPHVLSYQAFIDFVTGLQTAFSNIAKVDFYIQTQQDNLTNREIGDYWQWAVNNCGIQSSLLHELCDNNVPELDDGRVNFYAVNDLIKDFMNNKAIEPILSTYQKAGFPKFTINTMVDETESQERIKELKAAKKERDEKLAKKAQVAAAKANAQKVPASSGSVMIGRKIADNVDITPLENITEEERSVVVNGYVFSKEIRALRSGRSLMILKITDYTSSITIKKFSKDDEEGAKFANLEEGSWITARGSVQEDNYSHELAMNAYDINPATHAEREDTANKKRAELHLHSNMSQMDATNSISDFVKQAKKWGHKAIAVTDHDDVQAFPEAFNAAQNNDIKMLYGMEANVVDDGEPIAYNDKHVGLKDATYVVFDTETTGLSAIYDRVIELSAVKMQGNNVIEEFEQFIDPGFHLSEQTTNLTSITDDMVAGSKSEEEVFKMFREFCGDSIVVGHNVTFDIGFMNTGYARHGMEPIKNPIIDTLTLARFLYPNYKSYRLNTLAKKFDVVLEHHHRAIYDAETTGHLNYLFLKDAEDKYDIQYHDQLNDHMTENDAYKHARPFHAILMAKTQAVFKKLRIVPEEQQNTRLRIVCKAQYMGGCGFVVVCSHCQNRSKHNFCGVPSSRYRI